MGFLRFRRTLKIAPGIRMNVGKTGVSWSFGRRGAHVTVGRRGVRTTVGLPGTGLSYTSHASSTTHTSRRSGPSTSRVALASPGLVARPGIDPARFHIEPVLSTSAKPTIRVLLFVAGTMVLAGGFVMLSSLAWVGVLLIVIGFTLPSGRTLQEAVIDRCWLAAQKELIRRLAIFNSAATEAEKTTTLACLRSLLELQQRLGLSDVEAGAPRLTAIRGDIHFLEFQAGVAAAGGGLPIVTRDEKVTAPDVCHFAGMCTYDKAGDHDPRGILYLTDKRAIFLADEGLTTTSWAKVIAASRDRYALRIQRRDRQTPYLFAFDSLGEAMIAEWITASIMNPSQIPKGDP